MPQTTPLSAPSNHTTTVMFTLWCNVELPCSLHIVHLPCVVEINSGSAHGRVNPVRVPERGRGVGVGTVRMLRILEASVTWCLEFEDLTVGRGVGLKKASH